MPKQPYTHVVCGAGGRQGEMLVRALLADKKLLEAATASNVSYVGTSMGAIVVRALASTEPRAALQELDAFLSCSTWRNKMFAWLVRVEITLSMLLSTLAFLRMTWTPMRAMLAKFPVRDDVKSIHAMVWSDEKIKH